MADQATDWTHYYASVPAIAKLTRKYTARVLLNFIRRSEVNHLHTPISIVEIGGANSCFLDKVLAEIKPCRYDIVDTNEYGLSLLRDRLDGNTVVRLHQKSVFAMPPNLQADLVFSVGLIEHFDAAGTREAILSHFDVLRPGGLAIITFPTPTLLYAMARKNMELLGLWKFHDERPLNFTEVMNTVHERAEVLATKILWPLVLTQGAMVARKTR